MQDKKDSSVRIDRTIKTVVSTGMGRNSSTSLKDGKDKSSEVSHPTVRDTCVD